PNRTLTIVDPGYSTGRNNGGIHSCHAGGGLRPALMFLAQSRHVAPLDDDNWFAPGHVADLLAAVRGFDWAFSYRLLALPDGDPHEDLWESRGPGRGIYARRHGGFVDTNCMMIDKLRCPEVLPLWAEAKFPDGTGEDRRVFDALAAGH